jgi:hypothetical protein
MSTKKVGTWRGRLNGFAGESGFNSNGIIKAAVNAAKHQIDSLNADGIHILQLRVIDRTYPSNSLNE